jgi:hypothetical protein
MANPAPAAGVPLSFRASSHEYFEKWTSTGNTQLTTTATDISPAQNSVQTYGFMRRIRIRLRNTTVSSAGSLNLNGDYPAKIISQLSLTDPNGAEVYGGPTWSGIEAAFAEKYGSYKTVNDPTLSPLATAGQTSTAPAFCWTIPIELGESTGFGSLPNMDAQSPYKLKVTQDTTTNIYTTAPTTAPIGVYDYILDAWTVPDPVNKLTGAQQTVFPPGMGNGVWGLNGPGCTVQSWTLSTPSVTASTAMTAALIRKGNVFRNLVLVARNSSGARISLANGYPNPMTFQIDGAPLWLNIDPAYIQEMWARREGGQLEGTLGANNATFDTGVVPVMFSNYDGYNVQGGDGTIGIAAYLGSNQASRIEFAGTWGSQINSLQCLTNDVRGVSLVGTPYAWAFGQTIQAPSQPSVRTG